MAESPSIAEGLTEHHQDFYSAWARVRAAENGADGAEAKILEDLINQHWEAVYAFFRAVTPSPSKALGAMLWLRRMAPSWVHQWPELWMLHGRFRLSLHVWLSTQYKTLLLLGSPSAQEITLLTPNTLDVDEALAPLLEERLSPHDILNRVWPWSVESRSKNRLEAEWDALGAGNLARELAFTLDMEPCSVDFGAVAANAGMSQEEVEMASSSLRLRYLELLREHVRDTVVSPADFETEWADLFPDFALG